MRDAQLRYGGAVAAGLVFGILAAAVAHVSGHSVRPWLCCALAVTGALLLAASVDLAARVGSPQLRPVRHRESLPLSDRKRGGLDASVRLIERGVIDPDRFEALRSRLLRLAEERLRTTRNIDLRAEPDRAREVLGEGFVALTAGRPNRLPGRAELDDWLSRLEHL